MNFQQLKVGMSTQRMDTITEAYNTRTIECFVRKIIYTQLPGKGVAFLKLIEFAIRFTRNIYPGNIVVTTATIKNLDQEAHKVYFRVTIEFNGNIIGEGEAVIMLIP
jgi:predicted thioesterase